MIETHLRIIKPDTEEPSLKDCDDGLEKGNDTFCCQVYHRVAQRRDANWVSREQLTCTL